MPNIASTQPELQDQPPKQFRKECMQADLKTTASKFDEMANLFSVIKILLNQQALVSTDQIETLVDMGMHICEDWSDNVSRMDMRIREEHTLYFH